MAGPGTCSAPPGLPAGTAGSSISSLILFSLLLITLPAVAATPGSADTAPASAARHDVMPVIAIIIDDLGNLESRDTRAIRLPGNITCSFLPHTPYARRLATLAHQLDKEVMLHVPMQSLDGDNLGPGGLTLDMTQQAFVNELQRNLDAVPYAVGVNNHMGSLLTQHPGHMAWLMKQLAIRDNLYFVDSFTTDNSVASRVANEYWIPNLQRDIFLDDNQDSAAIKTQFERLLAKARHKGIALGIGHPYPETLALLEEELPRLQARGIRLLPVSQLLHHDSQRTKSWYALLSR